ncbi:hypothetical protein OROMI_019384 [Orobanche minor]
MPSQEILKIRDGTPFEAEGILTYRKRPPKLLGFALYSKLAVPSNVVQKKSGTDSGFQNKAISRNSKNS